MIDSIKQLYIKYKEIINYLIFGVLTVLLNLIVKYILLFTVLNVNNAIQVQIAICISWIVAVIFAYITNRKFVFKSNNENKIKECINFIIARVSTLLLEMIIIWFFITFLELNTNFFVVLITVLTQGLVIVVNYVLSKLIIFNKQKP